MLVGAGVWNGAMICVAQMEFDADGAAADAKNAPRRGSALRDNVDTKGTNAYYYAHSGCGVGEVPEEHRFVYGGDFILVDESQVLKPTEVKVVATNISCWSWTDDGAKVKIYIEAEKEPKAVVAAKDGKEGEV